MYEYVQEKYHRVLHRDISGEMMMRGRKKESSGGLPGQRYTGMCRKVREGRSVIIGLHK